MAKDRIELILDAKNRTNKAFNSAQKNISKLEKSVKNIQRLGNVFTSLFAVNQIAGYAQDLGKIADEWKNIEARLKLVTNSSEELIKVQDDLFNISQETSSSYAETAKLYTQVARNSEALGVSNKDLLNLTEAINKSIQVSGASSQASEAAITQLNQALASGVLRGDEFNSVMEQAPRLAEAMADGLGVPIGSLRDMASAGELTAKKVIKSLLDQKGVIDDEYSKLPITIGRAVTQINNEFGKFIAKTDEVTGASEGVANSIVKIAGAFSAVTEKIAKFEDTFEKTSEGISVVSETLSDALLKMIPGAEAVNAYLDYEAAQKKVAEAANKTIEELTALNEKTNSNKESMESFIESLKNVGIEAEGSRDILAEFGGVQIDTGISDSVQDIVENLEEERRVLTLTAKEQFIYNQVKKAGTDATYEDINAIKKAAESLFDEKEAVKAAKNETKELSGATKEYKKTADSISSGGSSSSAFGRAKKDAEELTTETEKATKAKKKWLSTTGGAGVDTSDAFNPVNLTPQQAEQKALEITTAMQRTFDLNPVQVKVNVPTAKQITDGTISSSYFSSPLSEGGSGLSAISVAETALKEGTKQ